MGTPRDHDSDLPALVYGACRRQFRSYRRLTLEVAQQWPALRAACQAEGVGLGDDPVNYNHWEGARDRALRRLDAFRRAFTTGSLELSNGLGLLSPRAGSISRPDRSQVVYGDGTHLRGKFKSHLGEWHDDSTAFSVGVRVPCYRETFTHWLTFPAAAQGRRHSLKLNLDKVRPFHRDDDVFKAVYAVRNDAEAANAEYEKHLLDTRASQVGGDRNLLDAILFFAGQNALDMRRQRRAGRPAA